MKDHHHGIPEQSHADPAAQVQTIVLDPEIPRKIMHNVLNNNTSPAHTQVQDAQHEDVALDGIAGSRTAATSSTPGTPGASCGIPDRPNTEGDICFGSASAPVETSGSNTSATSRSGAGAVNRAPAVAAAIGVVARRAALIAQAISYAQNGWRVIPVQWPKEFDGQIVCSCWRHMRGLDCGRSSAKHPLWDDWPELATTDVNAIERWWGNFKIANVGLAMGYQPGGFYLVAVDEDVSGALAALATEQGETIPPTWTQSTGRGTHFVFVVPAELLHLADGLTNRTKLVNGLDIRANGGIIVAAPSTSMSNVIYAITNNIQPAPLPVWLFWLIVDRACKARKPSIDTARPADATVPVPLDTRIADGIQRCLRHPPAIDGDGGDNMTWTLVLALVRGLVLPGDVALDLLLKHYNNKCIGPWEPSALQHKIDWAESEKTTAPWGFLLAPLIVGAAPAATLTSSAPAPAPAATGPNLNTMSPSVCPINARAPLSNIISLAPSSKPRARTVEIATVRFRGTERRGANGQHTLRLLIETGTHAGMTKRWPLDWPRTNRSAERLDHLAAALDLDEIRNPLRDTWDKTAQAEVVTNPDGTVHVRRIFKP
jgi:hypothetical protein